MHFCKLAAAGLDYICIDSVTNAPPHELDVLSRSMCDRHYGAGADALVILQRSSKADIRVLRFRADGESDVPGSVGRGVAAAFALRCGLVRQPQVRVEWESAVTYVNIASAPNGTITARVDLGAPVLQADRIPTTLPGNPPVEVPVTFPDTMHNVAAVSMGVPFAVIFIRQLSDAIVQDIGTHMENHPGFPQRTNVALVKVNRPDDATVRVWERRRGEVVASGLGAAAVAVAGSLTGKTRRQLTAHFPKGDLQADWDSKDNHVYLTCNVAQVYEGDWPDHA